MTITTYQIRNVLRTYSNQLKRRTSVSQDSVSPVQSSADLVDISVEARKRQVLSQLSERLIAKVTSQEQREQALGGGSLRAEEDEGLLFKEVAGK